MKFGGRVIFTSDLLMVLWDGVGIIDCGVVGYQNWHMDNVKKKVVILIMIYWDFFGTWRLN